MAYSNCSLKRFSEIESSFDQSGTEIKRTVSTNHFNGLCYDFADWIFPKIPPAIISDKLYWVSTWRWQCMLIITMIMLTLDLRHPSRRSIYGWEWYWSSNTKEILNVIFLLLWKALDCIVSATCCVFICIWPFRIPQNVAMEFFKQYVSYNSRFSRPSEQVASDGRVKGSGNISRHAGLDLNS